MMTQTSFLAAYERLNPAQKQAVDTIDGPVMVIAGPGTGKTQILTLRIAAILDRTDTAPESVLALTFTESGAKAMRERLRQYIGAAAYQVPIYTFHGFAEQLIRRYPESYERVIGGRPASEVEKIELLELILAQSTQTTLRPLGDPTYYVRPILQVLSELKREYVTPDTFATLLATQETALQTVEQYHTKGAHVGKVRGEYTKLEKSLIKNKALLGVYRQYESLMRERRLYDFDDMIIETIEALQRNEDMLRDLQEQYQYVLADEHQDVNGSQNKILELLCHFHERPNIFVVGDEKQAIYRFQGASLENFLYFEDVFPGTTTIALTENYRSGQTILDAAHSLVAVEDGPLVDLRVPLTAAAVESSKVAVRSFSHQAVEDAWVVAAVTEAITQAVPLQEIAVVVRTNREVEQYAAALRTAGIAVEAAADGDILTHTITETVRALLAATCNAGDERALTTVLHGAYWNIPAADIVRVLAARSYEQPLAALLSDSKAITALSLQDPEAVKKVGAVLAEARARAVSQPPHRVVEYLVTASGLLEHLLVHDPIEGTRVIRRLYDELEVLLQKNTAATLESVVAMFATLTTYKVSLTAPYMQTAAAAVIVLTAHRAKGLEYDTVIVPHLTDKNWGGRTKRQLFTVPLQTRVKDMLVDQFDDERRLLYVAMTRAKRTLLLSYADKDIEGKELAPSRLLTDIETTAISTMSVDDFEAAFNPASALQATLSAATPTHTELVSLLAARGFSATSLNNYLESPWVYVYRNLLRVPEVQSAHLLFGTAIHSVLESVTRAATVGNRPSDAEVVEYLTRALKRLPINTTEYTRLHEKGMQALLSYLPTLYAGIPVQTKEEFAVRVMLPTGLEAIPELPLTGTLDRIDLDGTGRALRVVDYKTGSPKTRGVIEGTTKTSTGDYKRQLVFYALLLSLYDDERYVCREAVLSFVEPDAKGVVHEEVFVITDAEIEELRAEIIQAVADFCTGDFLLSADSAAGTQYEQLVRMLLQTRS